MSQPTSHGHKTPTVATEIGDLKDRVRRLEMRTVATGRALYIADQILPADTATVIFDAIPGDQLASLRLDYWAWTTAESGIGVAVLRLNGDDLDLEHQYQWNLDPADPIDTLSQQTDATMSNDWGAFAFVPTQASFNVAGAGRVVFPNPSDASDDDPSSDGIPWAGHGGAPLAGGGNSTPDTWTAAGYQQGRGPLTRLALAAYDIADTGFTTPLTWKKHTRFTLFGVYTPA